jgi:acetyl esterase/lipase
MLAAPAGAQTPPPPPFKDYPAKPSAMGGGVTWLPDIAYATVPGFRPLKLDIYRPEASTRSLPLLVYIHGGAWQAGHPRSGGTFSDFPGLLASFAANGYVVAAISYRLSGEAPFPAALDDVNAALDFLRGHAPQYGIDPAKIVLWGASAGGHLAALAALSCNDRQTPERSAPCVQGVIDWYGVGDVKTWALETPRGREASEKFMGCKIEACDPALLSRANPHAFIDAGDPPFLIQAGDSDTVVSVETSKSLHAALRAKGVASELVIYAGIEHSLANFPREPNPVNEAVNRRAPEKMLEFLARTVPPSSR